MTIIKDTEQVPYTIEIDDIKGNAVAGDPSLVPVWSVQDPSTLLLTVAADSMSAVVAAVGGLTAGNQVSVQVAGFTGIDVVQVVASDAASVKLVAGTPVPQPPAAPAA